MRVSYLVFLFSLLSGSQSAVTTRPVMVSDAQATKVAVQSLAAMGSTRGLPSIRATGTIQSADQGDGTFEVVATGPRTYRTTTTRDSGTYIYLMNDGIGAVTFNGQTRHIGGSEVMAARCPFLPFYSFVGELDRTDVVLGPVRAGSINGNPTFIISTTTSDLSNPSTPLQSLSEMEVDARTSIPLKLRTQLIHSENIEIVSHLEYTFEDYRQEGVLLLPHSITLTVDGALAYVVKLTSFQTNVTADLTVTFQ